MQVRARDAMRQQEACKVHTQKQQPPDGVASMSRIEGLTHCPMRYPFPLKEESE